MSLKKHETLLERQLHKHEMSEFSYPASEEELKMVLRFEGTDLPPLPIGRPMKVKYGAPVSTKLGVAHLTIIDRLLMSRVLGPGIGTRAELIRAAVHWYLSYVVQLGKLHRLETIWAQMEDIRQSYYALKKTQGLRESGTLARLEAKAHIARGRYDLAKQALWRAKKLAVRLTSEEDRNEFDARVCGAGEGQVRPKDWKDDEVAVLWDRVMDESVTPEGDLWDDEEVVDEEMAALLDGYNVPDPEEQES